MPLAIAAAQPIDHHPEQPAPAPQPSRRGNPNLGLAARCGARTRAGCPCQAPAIRGKLRCRMHGGRSTGPRTAEGMARLRTARTTHGGYTPETRAFNRHVLTMIRRARVGNDALRYEAHLPPDLAARLHGLPPELSPPRFPATGLSRTEDRAVLQAEAAAIAPWKHAIALARQASHRGTVLPPGSAAAEIQVTPEAHAPGPAQASPAEPASVRPEAHAPERRPTVLAAEASAAANHRRTQPGAHAPGPARPSSAEPASVQPEAHTPEGRPTAHAPETPTAGEDRRTEPGAQAPEPVPAAARTQPTAHAPASAPTTPKPQAPEPPLAPRAWDGIRRLLPLRTPTLRQRLLAGTTHSTITFLADHVGGWATIARGTALLEAAAALPASRANMSPKRPTIPLN